MLRSLNLDSFRHLRTFLESGELSSLLGTSKSLFGVVKREIFDYHLNDDFSKCFFDEIDDDKEQKQIVRSLLLSRVKDPVKQISLSLENDSLNHSEDINDFLFSSFNNGSDFSYVGIRFQLFDVPSLIGISFTDSAMRASTVKNLLKLEVEDCVLEDLSCLSSCSSLSTLLLINSFALVDISCLSFLSCLKSITLKNCWKLVNVVPLGHVDHVELDNCPAVNDVSSLTNVYDLVLHFCPGIIDISLLQNNYRISILRCENIKITEGCFKHSNIIPLMYPRFYSSENDTINDSNKNTEGKEDNHNCYFPEVKVLDIRNNYDRHLVLTRSSYFSQSSSLRTLKLKKEELFFPCSFQNIQELCLYNYDEDFDCSMFRNILRLDFQCPNLSSLKGLKLTSLTASEKEPIVRRTTSIILRYNKFIEDYSPLNGFDSVHIIGAAFETLSTLTNVRCLKLFLEDCLKLNDVSNFDEIKELKLYGLENVTSLTGLEKVQSLEVVYCEEITNYSMFATKEARNQRLVISEKTEDIDLLLSFYDNAGQIDIGNTSIVLLRKR
jgi:hypothetical protein